MWTKKNKSERRDYDREMLKTSLVSLFWNILAFRKAHSGFSQGALAEQLGVNKSAPSRWFSGSPPNWEANTIADIANALDVDIEICARDRKTGTVFASHGVVATSYDPVITMSGENPDAISLSPETGKYREISSPIKVFAVRH